MKRLRRLPFAPLNDAVGAVYKEHVHGTADRTWMPIPGNHCTILAELTGINRHSFVKWVKDGIPEDRADEIAVALGLHVAEIWPMWWGDSGVELQGAPVVADAPQATESGGFAWPGTDATP